MENLEVPMKAIELKKTLREIKSGERNWEEENIVYIIKSMVEHIGSIDSELRDQLIYSSFYQLIIEKNSIKHELLNELVDFCLSDLLYKGIGENGTDSVFTRSFTTLLLALILSRDNEDNFFPKEKVLEVKDHLLEYIKLEKDFRGYVAVKGWAHSAAHVTDAIDELVKSPKIDKKFYSEIVKVLWSKVFVSTSVYIHNEDERILIPIMEMLKNGLEQLEIEILLQNVPRELEMQKEQLPEEEYWFLYFNCKTFLKSFYIKVDTNDKFISLKESIKKCLFEIALS